VEEVMTWKTSKPELFAKLCAYMGADDVDLPESNEVRKMLQGNLSFAAYLAFSIRSNTQEFVEVSETTMVGVLTTIVIGGVLAENFHITAEHVDAFFFVVTYSLALMVFCLTVHVKGALDLPPQQTLDKLSWINKRITHERNFGTITLRVLQGAFNFVSYSIAGSLLEPESWTRGLVWKLATFVGCAAVIGFSVPDFSIIIALPPFFGPSCQDLLLKTAKISSSSHMKVDYVDEDNVYMLHRLSVAQHRLSSAISMASRPSRPVDVDAYNSSSLVQLALKRRSLLHAATGDASARLSNEQASELTADIVRLLELRRCCGLEGGGASLDRAKELMAELPWLQEATQPKSSPKG